MPTGLHGKKEEVGTALADKEAKRVAEEGEADIQSLIPDGKIQTECEPKYSKEDLKLIEYLEGKVEKGKRATTQNKTVVPLALLWSVVMSEHRKTHWVAEALYKYLNQRIVALNLYTTVRQVMQQREICLRNNPKTGVRAPLGQIGRGNYPGQQWQIDFSELPRKGGFWYLLVLTDTFSGWPEAFPCRTSKAKEVTKILLQEIVPRFVVPAVISSDRGAHFIAKIVQQITRLLGIDRQLHTPY